MLTQYFLGASMSQIVFTLDASECDASVQRLDATSRIICVLWAELKTQRYFPTLRNNPFFNFSVSLLLELQKHIY